MIPEAPALTAKTASSGLRIPFNIIGNDVKDLEEALTIPLLKLLLQFSSLEPFNVLPSDSLLERGANKGRHSPLALLASIHLVSGAFEIGDAKVQRKGKAVSHVGETAAAVLSIQGDHQSLETRLLSPLN